MAAMRGLTELLPELRLLYMSAQTIWMMKFTQVMAILIPGISLQDHLNKLEKQSALQSTKIENCYLPFCNYVIVS